MITEEMAQQAAALTQRGTTIQEIASSWNLSAGAMYKALQRYGIEYKRETTSPEQHLEQQRLSGLPPEIYAERAGLTLATMRRYAWELKQPLAINTFAARKEWWLEKFDEFRPINAQAFCRLNELSVPMVAHWYHRLHNPKELLLWGFSQLLQVEGEQFSDYARFAVPRAELYAMGQGKACVPIEARIAVEAFRFATPLKTYH